MDDPHQLKLKCVIEGEYIVFPVTVGQDCVVSDLKEEIKQEYAVTFKDVDAHTLELWKVSAIDELLSEVTSLFSAQGLQPYRCVGRRHSG